MKPDLYPTPSVTPPPLADLELLFVDPTGLAVIPRNKSQSVVARDPKYLVSLWNLDEHGAQPGTFIALPAFRRIDSGDFIKPGDFGFGPSSVFDFTGPGAPYTVGRLKKGDRLIGFATVTCANCISTACYWISDVFGTGGWYSVRKESTEQDCMVASDASFRKIQSKQDDLLLIVPESMRMPIESKLPVKKSIIPHAQEYIPTASEIAIELKKLNSAASTTAPPNSPTMTGNVKERAVSLANELNRFAASRWNFLQERYKTVEPGEGRWPIYKSWDESTSGWYQHKYEQRVLLIVLELADLHLRDQRLDDDLEMIKKMEDLERLATGYRESINLFTVQEISERMAILANSIR